MLDSKKYCAFIADMVSSTKINTQKRTETQLILKEVMTRYNAKYANSIEAKIDFSSGDQFQALFNNAQSAYMFACDFREAMFPVRFRIGLGVGDWSINFPGENKNMQDGTSYHNARKAFEYAYKFKKSMILHSDNEMDAYVNVLIAQEYAIFNSQSEKQKQVFAKYKEVYPLSPAIKKEFGVSSICIGKSNQKVIAEEFGTSIQNINKHIHAGLISIQRDLQGAIILFLTDIL
jgi:hypothetical protein